MDSQPKLAEYTRNILSLIAKHYELDLNDLSTLVHAELDPTITGMKKNEVSKYCCAFIKTDKKICQCSRGKKDGIFCITHAKQHADGKLKYGFKKETTTVQEMEKIMVNGTEHFYNKFSNKVYSVDTLEMLGYLREDDETCDIFIEEQEKI